MGKHKTAKGKCPQVTTAENIEMDAFTVHVLLNSPLHLGSGQADVNVDAEVVHDQWGMPYFPAKRFKGLLYESALEVSEILAACGADSFTKEDVDTLFQHGCHAAVQLIIPNLYLPDYEAICQEWAVLQQRYGDIFQPLDVLEQYTSLRYQTVSIVRLARRRIPRCIICEWSMLDWSSWDGYSCQGEIVSS